MMNYNEILEKAKENMKNCKVCADCNCAVCSGKVPGPGGKGSGNTAIRNRNYWRQQVKLNQDVIAEAKEPNTEVAFLGKKFSMPVFVAPIGMVALNLGDAYNEYTYAKAVLEGAKAANTLAFTGGGAVDECFFQPLKAIEDVGTFAVPTLKPWRMELVEERIKIAEKSNPLAIAMDIDSAGLPHSNASLEPMMAKSKKDIADIVNMTKLPFIVKGIMTVDSAIKAAEAGAYGIVVSNHGGRVMDDGLATGEVLYDICKAVKGKVKILVDGGIRNGGDVCKALAMGADGVLIGRPCSVAVYGGDSQGLTVYLQKIQNEIKDIMKMIGCYDIKDIDEKAIKIL